jgi:hypothetical protein
LYLSRAGLLLENGVVARTVALALLAVAAHRMGFVALEWIVVSGVLELEG